MTILTFEEIDSTNDYIKRNIEQLQHLTVVHSYYQSKGKGRNGHVWQSDKGDNLLISLLIKDFTNASKVHHVTQIAALSIVALLKIYKIPAYIKWPNDIFVDGDKIAGILVEAVYENELQGVVIGIGLNVNTKNYQSISSYLEKEIDIIEVRGKLIYCLQTVYKQYINKGYNQILESVNNLSYLKDKPVAYKGYGVLIFKQLLENGMLLAVDENQNNIMLHVNEISLHQD